MLASEPVTVLLASPKARVHVTESPSSGSEATTVKFTDRGGDPPATSTDRVATGSRFSPGGPVVDDVDVPLELEPERLLEELREEDVEPEESEDSSVSLELSLLLPEHPARMNTAANRTETIATKRIQGGWRDGI